MTDPHASAVPSPLKISGKFTNPVNVVEGKVSLNLDSFILLEMLTPIKKNKGPKIPAEETHAYRVSDVTRSNTPVLQEPRQIRSTPAPLPHLNLHFQDQDANKQSPPQRSALPRGASSEPSQMSQDSHGNHPEAIIMSHSGLAPTRDGTYGRSGNVTIINGKERIDSMVAVLEHPILSPSVYSPQPSPNVSQKTRLLRFAC